jgi:transcriptional regulator of heat shock response
VVYSQVSTENKEQIEEIKKLLQENHSKFEAESELNVTQNELLKKKEKAKIEAELKLVTSDRIIVSGLLYEKVNRIFNQIILANPTRIAYQNWQRLRLLYKQIFKISVPTCTCVYPMFRQKFIRKHQIKC